jgi:hypothetical protein
MSRPPTATTVASHRRTRLARLLLQADGLVVGVGGAVLLARTHPLASALGLTAGWPLATLGAACVPYGAWLFWAGTRASGASLRRLAGTIAVANTAWVIASAALLLGHTPALTPTGRWVVAAQAGAVALFAVAEVGALRWTV